MSINVTPTMYLAKDVPVENLIGTAFQVRPFQIVDGPEWTRSDLFVIEAKFPASMDPTKLPMPEAKRQFPLMVRSMLVDRFHLRYHMATREFPGFSLVVAKGGPKLQPAKPGEPYSGAVGHDKVIAHSFTAQQIAQQIGFSLGQKVQDNTQLAGTYDFTLNYASDGDDVQTSSDDLAVNSRIMTAIQEQLGLKLVAQKISLPVVVIDHIEPPTPN